jgi:hypothetical protein
MQKQFKMRLMLTNSQLLQFSLPLSVVAALICVMWHQPKMDATVLLCRRQHTSKSNEPIKHGLLAGLGQSTVAILH